MKINNEVKRLKAGFTLIEVIAALAIISILAGALIPKVSKYIDDAKKTKALEDVRQVVLAVESYNMTSSSDVIDDNKNFSYIKSKIGNTYFDMSLVKSIDNNMKYETMQELMEGQKEYSLKDGVIIVKK